MNPNTGPMKPSSKIDVLLRFIIPIAFAVIAVLAWRASHGQAPLE